MILFQKSIINRFSIDELKSFFSGVAEKKSIPVYALGEWIKIISKN
jgi:hypothetical protein